jgi:hypothetical protein
MFVLCVCTCFVSVYICLCACAVCVLPSTVVAEAYEALMSTNMGSVANMVLTLINTGNSALLCHT